MMKSDAPNGAGWSFGQTGAAAPGSRALGDSGDPKSIGRGLGSAGPAEKFICGKDLVWLAALPVLIVPAWLLPLPTSERMIMRLARLLRRIKPQRYLDYERMFRATLPGPHSDEEIDALVVKTISLHHLERFYLLRLYRPLRWQPQIRVEGLENVEHARARGNGAILWVKSSSFGDVMAKIALSRAGYGVFHLSRHTHGGFSVTRFGIRFLNPMRTRIESSYLAQRVVIDPQKPKAALQRLEELLAQNHIVSITVGAEANRVTMIPAAGGLVPIAGGPAKLAIRSGAPLLPVFAERCEDGSFLVTIEAPLEAPAASTIDEKLNAMLHRYGSLMESHFERLPSQHHWILQYMRAQKLMR